ncbi:thiamine-phosphate kinase [Chitinimonas sp. BJYL2]|uniref:thiamine-phosphate kinase n=1 Tax=Chitinimonas sp. BJYL2 TaxID=2976696 RepID=UPI0022B36A4D|nr:thiamine-phosphate kinase [Chitinimonas sp. BJYL2]
MPLDEFSLIQRYFTRATPGTVLGVGDDCALIAPTPCMQLAISTDTLVEGRHFFPDIDPESLGWKSLAVNLSDLAAMGAKARWFTLCLTLPQANETWLSGFARGLFALADAHGVDLVGGDTTRGPLTISIQVMGEVAPGKALRRDAGKAGDDLWLSGPTGAAALAVQQRYGKLTLAAADSQYCAQRLDRPEPRLALGQALAGLAHAAIDISDGLLADIGHLAARSKLQARLMHATLPTPPLSADLLAQPAFLAAQLGGGDDYELAFSAPVTARAQIAVLADTLGLPLMRIGTLAAGEGVVLLDANGQPQPLPQTGFNHFS